MMVWRLSWMVLGVTGIALIVLLQDFFKAKPFERSDAAHVDEKGKLSIDKQIDAVNMSSLLVTRSSEKSLTPTISAGERMSAWFQNHSTMEKVTLASYRLTNVCIQWKEERVKLLSYHPPHQFHFSLDMEWPLLYGYLQATTGYQNATVWQDMVRDSLFITKEAVWLDDCSQVEDNPAHCLTDQSFPLALDRMQSGKLSYPTFLYGNKKQVHVTCPNLCCHMVSEQFGLVDLENMMVMEQNGPPLCFAQLIVPRLGTFRTLKPTRQSRRAVRWLQQCAFRRNPGLSTSPWTSNETTPIILLYDRTDARRRKLANATEIQRQLQDQFVVQVDLLGAQDWLLKNLSKQAELYNSYHYIVAPHGAHLINLIYARPFTRMLEIQCAVNKKNNVLAQFQDWFVTWTSDIQIDHRIHVEDQGCRHEGKLTNNYSPLWVRVDLERFVEETGRHFGLKRREGGNVSTPYPLPPQDSQPLESYKEHLQWPSRSETTSGEYQSPQEWFVEESAVLEKSNGTVLLHNVCIQWRRHRVLLISQHPNATGISLELDWDPYYKHLRQTVGHRKADWANLVRNAPYISEETVLLDDCIRDKTDNPAHCMNDQAFALAVDLLYHDYPDTVPLYSKFVYANYKIVRSDCNGFCCRMLADMFGFTRIQDMLLVRRNGPPTCFAKLRVPRVPNMRHGRTKEAADAIKMMQRRMFRLNKNLDDTPWPDNNASGTPRVFLYDRTDSNRRRLANSTAIKYRLEAQYDVKVDLWGEEWKNASKNQTWQAEVYNSYQYILAPHGAHFFNLIYTRPETKVVEIQCQMIYQNIRAFHQQWFAVWAPFVDIQFRVFTEDQGCREDGKLLKNYSPSWVFANITLLVEEAAKHFGLHKRREGLGM